MSLEKPPDTPSPLPGGSEARAPELAPAARWSSKDLFRGSRRVVIEHDGQEYVLVLTRHGRLLLNRSS